MALLLLVGILMENPITSFGLLVDYSNLLFYFDLPTILFVAVPCVLLVGCFGFWKDLVNAFPLAFGRGEPAAAQCRKSAGSLGALLAAAFIGGGAHGILVALNGLGAYDPAAGLQPLLVVAGLVGLSFFYPLLLLLALLPVWVSLKARQVSALR